MNMLSTIVPKSDQINADDLIGGPRTITVTEVKFSGGTEQPVSMYFEGSDKAFRPCKSMCRVLVAAWGPDAKEYVGRSMTLYRDPSVKWGGMEVGGIRISHMTHIQEQMAMALTATKGVRKPFIVKPLAAQVKAIAFTIDDARHAMNEAESLDDLKVVWSRKSMAPFREELASLLEQRKKDLDQPATVEGSVDGAAVPETGSGEQAAPDQGRSVEDTGEAHTADDLISQIERITGDEALVDSFLALHADTIDAYPVADQRRIRGVANARKIELADTTHG
jgi:hypothetical protein